MKSVKFEAALVCLLFVFAAAPLAAQNRNIKISVFASQVDMQEETDFGDGFVLDTDEGNGYGASASVFVGRFFSVDAALFNLRTDTSLIFEESALFDLGTLRLTPITLGAQFHPLGGSRFDPYVGAGAAYVMADDLLSPDLEAAGVGRIELEDTITYYINAGLAVELTQGFGLVIDGRQLQYEPSSRSIVTGVERDLQITPRILSAGLRLRF